MIVSDAPYCGITYDRHYDNCNSFIIQATGHPDTDPESRTFSQM